MFHNIRCGMSAGDVSRSLLLGPRQQRQKPLRCAIGPYIVTTIFPRCLFASICSNALPISANG